MRVLSNAGRLTPPEAGQGSGTVDVGTGTVVFVPAGEEHRLTDVAEDLTVLVFFGPAEYTRRER